MTTIIKPDTGNIMIREDTPKDVAIAYIDTVDADMTSAGMVDISMNEDCFQIKIWLVEILGANLKTIISSLTKNILVFGPVL